jgi:ribulose-phosphate 3-epimerase
MRPIRIAPSVISADFGNLKADLARLDEAGPDLLHVDIMDGHFVPNITFGPDIVKKIKSLTKLPIDLHLMISRPRKYVVKFIEAGAANITFHIESEDNPTTTISEIASFNCTPGLSVKPKTPLSAVRPYLSQIKRLLIMTVEPGFGGQKFMPDMMDKVRQAVEWRAQGKYDFDIEVDGGLDIYTTVNAVDAGAEVIVAGTAVFANPDLKEAIKGLRDSAAYALYRKEHPEEPPKDDDDDGEIKW